MAAQNSNFALNYMKVTFYSWGEVQSTKKLDGFTFYATGTLNLRTKTNDSLARGRTYRELHSSHQGSKVDSSFEGKRLSDISKK